MPVPAIGCCTCCPCTSAIPRGSRSPRWADLLQDVQLETVNRYLEEFRAVDAALLRVAEGRYGPCQDCGVNIDLERLKAQPEAIRCRYCQETHEAQQQKRAYGGSSL